MSNDSNDEMEVLATQFFTMLRSIDEFNEAEMRGTLMNQLYPTLREQCFLGNYIRAIANTKSLLKFTSSTDCQAISMIARSMFEIGIEIALIDKIELGPEKIAAFSEFERLKRAQKIVKFVQDHPARRSDLNLALHQSFIDRDGSRVVAKKDELWPGDKKLTHWSQKDLRARAELIGDDLLEIYDSEYQVHSWFAHGGITGIMNTNKDFYVAMSANSFRLAAESYEAILKLLVVTFQLYRTDTKLLEKLKYAKEVPFTENTDKQPSFGENEWSKPFD